MRKILIVDDEEDILDMLEIILSEAGYSVIKTTKGREVITIAKDQHPDLIMLDVRMPGAGGERITNDLRDDPATRNIPVIYQACLVKDKEVENGYVPGSRIGNASFVAKPYDRDKLLQTVARSISRKD